MVGWDTSFAESTQGDPLEAIEQHFQSVFQSHLPPIPARTDRPQRGGGLYDGRVTGCDPQSQAQKECWDQVSHELLMAILEQGEGEKLLASYNDLLHGVPKLANPTQPKHLRPMNVGSEACKTLSRLLLGRTQSRLQQTNSWQCASPGRQPADLIFTILRGMMQEEEWKRGVVYTKIDVEKLMDEAG